IRGDLEQARLIFARLVEQLRIGELAEQARYEQAMEEYLGLLAINERQLNYVRNRLSRSLEQEGALPAIIAVAERGVRKIPLNRGYRELLAWPGSTWRPSNTQRPSTSIAPSTGWKKKTDASSSTLPSAPPTPAPTTSPSKPSTKS
ncbi:MAG: hypothetical protein ACE10K_02670, partial [Rhodothermales bacterium]